MVIRDGIYPGGRKLITFANILQHDVFPLARILQLAQQYGQAEMRRPVEIEFAVNFDARTKSGVFYLLADSSDGRCEGRTWMKILPRYLMTVAAEE